ncbi:MAG: tripartite tricarboxylate transporter substrate binding protein [Hyphomicrobiales bacterium]|nr:tripartite tricarboxylate transporter substrate binding protein [Hyphomicrobiales bacterium]
MLNLRRMGGGCETGGRITTPVIRMPALALLALTALSIDAAAQSWPARPVRIVVPSPPAGGTDIIARVMAEHFSKAFKQQFFVENRPGAGNMIGIESVARAAPDGYTFLMTASTLALNSVLYKKVSYDPIRDFAPITLAARAPNVLIVNPSLPARSLAEFIAYAKQRPGSLTYGTPGIGTSPHMSMELLKSMAGIDLRHIPYRGTAPALTDVISGQIGAMFANALTAKPQIESGKVRALGLSTPTRSDTMPGIPAIAEAGVPGYESVQWYGFLAPAATPAAIVKQIHAEAMAALNSAEMKEKLAHDGAEPAPTTPEAFARHIDNELEKWRRVAKAAGIEPQ